MKVALKYMCYEKVLIRLKRIIHVFEDDISWKLWVN
jgi:hypothetical protein